MARPFEMLDASCDPRVGPMQTRKMAAQLQAANASSGAPVLFLSQPASGHGNDMPLERRISERADVFAFMMKQLNVSVRP